MNLVFSPHNVTDDKKYAKRLFNEDKFDLIHMHLKKFEELSKHHAKTAAIVIVRAGKVEFDFNGKTVTLTNENILYMEPYEDHSVRAIEDTDLILMKIK